LLCPPRPTLSEVRGKNTEEDVLSELNENSFTKSISPSLIQVRPSSPSKTLAIDEPIETEPMENSNMDMIGNIYDIPHKSDLSVSEDKASSVRRMTSKTMPDSPGLYSQPITSQLTFQALQLLNKKKTNKVPISVTRRPSQFAGNISVNTVERKKSKFNQSPFTMTSQNEINSIMSSLQKFSSFSS
jgi:hypothetical protein